MKLTKLALFAAGGFITIATIATFTAPKLSAAIRAALVEVVIPSKPFFGEMYALGASPQSVGPTTGVLGISNIVITNFESTRQQVSFFYPFFVSGGCGGSGSLINGGGNKFDVLVPANSTISIPYPTPMVTDGVNGCLAGEDPTGGVVTVTVTGFVN